MCRAMSPTKIVLEEYANISTSCFENIKASVEKCYEILKAMRVTGVKKFPVKCWLRYLSNRATASSTLRDASSAAIGNRRVCFLANFNYRR